MQANYLTKEEKKILLDISKKTLYSVVTTGKIPKFKITEPRLLEKRGVFVTLHKNHDLRGCIGYIFPEKPLYEAVIDRTIASATQDPRFTPVRKDELKHITIEISVLTVPVDIKSYNEIKIGKHGIIIKKYGTGAVFLPQVPIEQNWDLATTLTHLSMKAGLRADDWKQGASFSVFEAEVFSEESLK